MSATFLSVPYLYTSPASYDCYVDILYVHVYLCLCVHMNVFVIYADRMWKCVYVYMYTVE